MVAPLRASGSSLALQDVCEPRMIPVLAQARDHGSSLTLVFNENRLAALYPVNHLRENLPPAWKPFAAHDIVRRSRFDCGSASGDAYYAKRFHRLRLLQHLPFLNF